MLIFLQKIFSQPKNHLVFLVLLLLAVFSQTNIYPMDDQYYYQKFITTLVDQHKIDLSIPGYHGSALLAAPIYLITHSDYAINFLEIIAVLATLPLIYLTVKKLYQDQTAGVMAAYIYAAMPFITFTPFRGWTWASTIFFALLTIYLLLKDSRWSWLALSLGIIIKPFVITVLPFFIFKKKLPQFFFGLIIPVIYFLLQINQAGRVVIGVHPDWAAQNFFNLKNIISNLFITFQSYFSIHNFTPLHTTYAMDMIHFTPFLSGLTIIGIFYWQKYFTSKKIFLTLLAFLAVAYLLPASFSYYDRYYFTIFDLAIIIFAVKILPAYIKILPIIAGSFIYQFYYFYLSYQAQFWPQHQLVIFIIPFFIFVVAIAYSWLPQRWFKLGLPVQ